ncbi:RDD family protein [Candidatus Albibeggiatoa sp. nov. NOAA]|uniref:RDD family protein n=1 Tax=Candidatus Albibeggiatoa sp. nov. NOAA TaxID=3162724 RepID=UPI00330067E4|nr:RDD family protein [Thiotrichaceae bacterium]
MENYYEVLGISRYASTDEIKQATQQHIQLIKTAYATLSDNDKRQAYEANPSDIDYYALLEADSSATTTRLKVTAQEKLNALKSIYQTLSDPSLRETYDTSLSGNSSQSDELSHVEINTTNPDESSEYNPYAAPDTMVTDVLIDTEVQLASRLSRFIAYIYDFIIYIMPVALTMIAIVMLEESTQFELDSIDAAEALIMSPSSILYSAIFLVGMMGIFILNLIYLYRNGQTIGKKMAGIKIIRSDYTRAGLARIIFLRYFAMGLLGGIPVIGLVITLINYLMIFGKSRRCLHDYIADTIVVKVK